VQPQTAATWKVDKQGRSQEFLSEGDKTGGLGDGSPSARFRARTLMVVWPEAEDIYANNNCNSVLTKNP